MNAFFVGKFSTRKLFIGGIAWFGIASVVAALAPNFYVILLGRAMMAMATGIIMPMTFTLILLIFPREKRGSAMGIVGLIISFAPAIGPSLSGVLVDTVGWRMLFIIVAVLAALVVLFASFSLKNFEGFEQVPFDPASVFLLACGMIGLLYGISSATSAENILVPIALIVVGLVLLGLFVYRQTKLEVPLLRVQVLKTRKFRTVVILIALLQASLVGSEVVLPIYVQQVMGQTATVSGLLMLPGAVIGAICGLLSGRLFDRFGVRGIVIFGSVVLAVGAIGVTTFSMDMTILMVTVVYTTMSIGIQFLVTPLNTWGVNSLDNKVVQHGNALSATTNQVGASFGTAFIVSLTALGALFAPANADALTVTFTGVHVAFTGMCVMLLIVVLGVLLFVREKPSDEKPAEEGVFHIPGIVGVDREFLIADVMNPRPGYIGEHATVRDAIKIMRKRNTSGVPIVDADMHVIGFISDGDILKYLSNQGGQYFTDGTNFYSMVDQDDFWKRLGSLLELEAMKLATKQVISIEGDENVEKAFKMLSEKRIKKVPVLYEGKLVGTLSRSNIIIGLEDAEYILTHQQNGETA